MNKKKRGREGCGGRARGVWAVLIDVYEDAGAAVAMVLYCAWAVVGDDGGQGGGGLGAEVWRSQPLDIRRHRRSSR